MKLEENLLLADVQDPLPSARRRQPARASAPTAPSGGESAPLHPCEPGPSPSPVPQLV